MSDLTDERIAELVKHWGGYALEERATRTALLELQRRRGEADSLVTIADEAFGLEPVEPVEDTLGRIERGITAQRMRIEALERATAADEERVRSVAREAIELYGKESFIRREEVATRAAKQLASAAVRLTAEDERLLKIIARDVLEFGIGQGEPDMDDATEDQLSELRDKCCALLDRLLATVRQ